MHPLLRPIIFLIALVGAATVGWFALRSIAENVEALRSWRRAQGWIVRWNSRSVRVFPSIDRDAMHQAESSAYWTKYVEHVFSSKAEEAAFQAQMNEREAAATAEYEAAFPEVPVKTDLGLPADDPVPLLIDPDNPARVKMAGFLQMWFFPAAMLGWMLPMLLVAVLSLRLGAGAEPASPEPAGPEPTSNRWMFTPPPAALAGGIVLRSPPSYWQIALGWSMLGVALAVLPWFFSKDIILTKAISGTIVGAAFAVSVWISAWRDATLTLSANDHGVRLISITGWKDVPWEAIRGVELQRTYETYYKGRGMWELPSPGSIISSYAFTDASGRTVLHFGLDLIPDDDRVKLFQLCKARTGSSLQTVDHPMKY